MKSAVAQIQVFISEELSFGGNIARVLWQDDLAQTEVMQKIATDYNVPATSFMQKTRNPDTVRIRWFAPDGEIGLCGHGALAAIAYLGTVEGLENVQLQYNEGSMEGGLLDNNRAYIELDYIAIKEPMHDLDWLSEVLGIAVKEHYITGNKDVVLAESEEAVRNMKPDFGRLKQHSSFGFIVTAEGSDSDFVSRTLVPKVKQLEDPATGSSHATIAPFWAERLGKNQLIGYQLSKSGGLFECNIKEPRVKLTGAFKFINESE